MRPGSSPGGGGGITTVPPGGGKVGAICWTVMGDLKIEGNGLSFCFKKHMIPSLLRGRRSDSGSNSSRKGTKIPGGSGGTRGSSSSHKVRARKRKGMGKYNERL